MWMLYNSCYTHYIAKKLTRGASVGVQQKRKNSPSAFKPRIQGLVITVIGITAH